MEQLAPGPAHYLVSEANGTRSREVVTLASSNGLQAGAVLAKITASGEYTLLDPAATDGSQVAAAVLYAAVEASAAAKAVVITARDAEVAAHALAWPDGITSPQIIAAQAQLGQVGIVVR